MSERLPRTTLEQWFVLRTIVATGGFAQAASKLNKSQSAISYAVSRLQENLQVELLRPQGRRAVLTSAGEELLAEAAPLLDAHLRLESRAKSTSRGETLQIRMVVDALFPKARLFDALHSFSKRYPHVGVTLRETVRIYYEEVVNAADFDIAIVINEAGAPARPLEGIKLIPVASPDHPLARFAKPISGHSLNSYPRAEIRSFEASKKLPEVQGRPWLTNSFDAVIGAVKKGLCHALLPHHLIRREIEEGTIVQLRLAERSERIVPLGLLVAATSVRPTPIDVLADMIQGPD